MLNLIYYNIKHAKLTPNAKKIAKKCELVNFKFKIVSIKIMKNLKYITLGLKLSNIIQTPRNQCIKRRQTSSIPRTLHLAVGCRRLISQCIKRRQTSSIPRTLHLAVGCRRLISQCIKRRQTSSIPRTLHLAVGCRRLKMQ